MGDVTAWIRRTLTSRRESIPKQALLRAVHHTIIAERVLPGARVSTHGVGRPIDDEGARVDGKRATAILLIGSTTELNSAPVLPVSEPCFFRLSRDEDDTLYTRCQARLRVDELTRANLRKDKFLAILGHELRNPLAAIHNGIHLLSHQTEETSARQKIEAMIERQVCRMTQLVDDLLDGSRIGHGYPSLQRERIDLRDVVNNAIQTLESDIKQRNHRLATTLPDAPVWLQGDSGRLEQVFVNLLANASKYTDTGGQLAVSVHARDAQAVVRVRDSGIGFAPQALPHLFDLFWQADAAVSRSRSGLGIGLALVRDLVESHGGVVTAESAGLGHGSEFTVFLPRET